jgi:hypothetical protein
MKIMKPLRPFDRRVKIALLAIVLAAAIGAIWAVAQAVAGAGAQPTSLAAITPQGALLAIESPGFGALLHDWEHSPEAAAWLKSDNYAGFSRSRLFGRLADAQKEFAGAAGMPPDAAFLDEIAGAQSLFAWYDIGKLEFVYITRLAPGKAEQTRLLQSRSSFAQRQVGGATFYVRTRAADSGDAQPDATSAAPVDMQPPQQGGPARTVAFAVSGDYLLLATREDLMANALGLLAHTSTDSLATEPWYVDASHAAAASSQPPALRMALNLERIVKTPYFRSYWLPQNVTETGQYRAAMVDLYRESGQMREERVLLPKTAIDPGATQADLGGLAALVPARSGVFRAVATGDVAVALTAIDEKLLRRGVTAYANQSFAPQADVQDEDQDASDNADSSASASPPGNLPESDLEVRIDAPPRVQEAKPEEQLSALRGIFVTAGVTSFITVDSNAAGLLEARGAGTTLWVPIHSAVVVHAANPWDESTAQAALGDALSQRLSAGGLGLAWTHIDAAGGYASLGDARPLQLAVRGNLLFVADDATLMESLLAKAQAAASAAPVQARLIAGFDHNAVAEPFTRLTRLIDGVHSAGQRPQPLPQAQTEDAGTPPLFSGNLAGLSGTFAAMQNERIDERFDGAAVRQTVTYAWTR